MLDMTDMSATSPKHRCPAGSYLAPVMLQQVPSVQYLPGPWLGQPRPGL